jgi:3-deoxy-manno-octulosonate cytidylyltransferase (CMP-KDO synthetase)
MKTIGIVPARMAASRFPGKPLAKIHGRTMIEHCYERARLYKKWDGLFLATCDEEIAAVGRANNWPVIMTRDTHTRALDRVAEAAEKCGLDLVASDVVVCVQGDEPMLHPDMIEASIRPLETSNAKCTVLAMQIAEEETFLNADTVKVVHNQQGEVLYTSRSPVPYCKGKFSIDHGARRIYGIFAWRWEALKQFTAHSETYLEKIESCDSNRILDMNFHQVIAPYPFKKSFSVDSPEDLELVEAHMKTDAYWGKY